MTLYIFVENGHIKSRYNSTVVVPALESANPAAVGGNGGGMRSVRARRNTADARRVHVCTVLLLYRYQYMLVPRTCTYEQNFSRSNCFLSVVSPEVLRRECAQEYAHEHAKRAKNVGRGEDPVFLTPGRECIP